MYFIKRLLKYSSLLFNLIEHLLLLKFKGQEIKHNPVFIVGAPRTGSTILYQILTNYLNFSYPNNFVSFAKHSFYINFLLSRKIFKDKPHNTVKSNFGNTTAFGLNAPSEGGDFWYRWLPKAYDYISKAEAEQINTESLKRNILAVSNKFNRPLLFKNLNNSMRINIMLKMFPNSKFIFIKREPVYTIQSILLAREKSGVKQDEWWSVRPQNFDKHLKLSEIEMITKQVFEIEKEIYKQTTLLPGSFLVINYEELQSVNECLNLIDKFVGNVGFKGNIPKSSAIYNENKTKVSADQFTKIEKEVQKYDWLNYQTVG